MPFIEKIEKLLASNHIKDVIDEFLKSLGEVPQSNRDARNDANQLRGQIIVLSGRYTDLNNKINTNTMNADAASQERNALINSFVQIINQLSSTYPDLNKYLEEKDEDVEWFETQKKNSIEAYYAYFNKYPNGKYKADTIKLIGELEEVKLKQENEMKRLALLEKERRESDKQANEQRQPPPAGQAAYKAPVADHSSTPAKSKKGLWMILGVLVLVLIAVILYNITNHSSSTSEDTAINTSMYYYIQNKYSNKIMGVFEGSTDSVIVVLYDSADKASRDFVKFKFDDADNGWYYITAKHSKNVLLLNDSLYLVHGSSKSKINEHPERGLPTFYFELKKGGYFAIRVNQNENAEVKLFGYLTYDTNVILGENQSAIVFLSPFSEENFGDLDAAQWRLIPTGEKVEQ